MRGVVRHHKPRQALLLLQVRRVRHVPPAGATRAAAAASAAARAGLARSVRAVSVATAAVEPVPVAAAAVGAVPVAASGGTGSALAAAAAGARFVAAVASFDAELRRRCRTGCVRTALRPARGVGEPRFGRSAESVHRSLGRRRCVHRRLHHARRRQLLAV